MITRLQYMSNYMGVLKKSDISKQEADYHPQQLIVVMGENLLECINKRHR